MYLLLIIITWLISDVLSHEQLYTNADYIDIDSILSNEDHLEGHRLTLTVTDITKKTANQAPQNCIGLLTSHCIDYIGGWSDYHGTGCIFHSTKQYVYVITAAHNIWIRNTTFENDRFCKNHRFYWKVIDNTERDRLEDNHGKDEDGKRRVLAGDDLERAWVADQYTNLIRVKSKQQQSQYDWGILKYRNTLDVPPRDSTLAVAAFHPMSSLSFSHTIELDLPTIEIHGKVFHAKLMRGVKVKSAPGHGEGLYRGPRGLDIIGGMSGSPLFKAGTQQQVAIVSRGGVGDKSYMTRITESRKTIIQQIVAGEWKTGVHSDPANNNNPDKPKLVYLHTHIQPLAQIEYMDYMDYMDDMNDRNGYYHQMNPLLFTLWLVFMMLLTFICCCILASGVVAFYSFCCYYQYNKATLPQQHIDIESV